MNDTRRRVLDAIVDGPIPGPELADDLDVSRAAIWKHVEALREAGFDVTSTQEGYELAGSLPYGEYAIESDLDVPYSIKYHDTIGSTNERARSLAASGASDVAVVAGEQTGSRGRLDRAWEAPPGGVWASVVCRPDVPPSHVPVFTLAAAVAVTETAREAGVDARIKWPNDVLVPLDDSTTADTVDSTTADTVDSTTDEADSTSEDTVDSNSDEADSTSDDSVGSMETRKLAGILTEMEGEADRVSWVVVGIGVNVDVASEDLPPAATSVRIEDGAIDRAAFAQRVLERFYDYTADGDLESILSAWRTHALTLGQRVRVDTPGGVVEGVARDVEFPGALVVETADGDVRVTAGDCEHLRPARPGN